MSNLYRSASGGGAAVKISTDAGNAIKWGTDSGLFAPSVEVSTKAGNALYVATDGGLFAPSVEVSTKSGNALYVATDGGLYVPKTAISTDAGNIITTGSDGGLFAAAPGVTLPYASWEIGYSGQANGGKGIDMGTWYRLDMSMSGAGVNNNLAVVVDANGYATLPYGQYLIVSSAHCIATPGASPTNEVWHASMLLEQQYGFPGIYQNDAMFHKTLNTFAEEFSMSLSTPLKYQLNPALDQRVCFGYAKSSNHTMTVQGFIAIVKVG